MKPFFKTVPFLLVFAFGLYLAGCVNLDQKTTVNSDGSGSIGEPFNSNGIVSFLTSLSFGSVVVVGVGVGSGVGVGCEASAGVGIGFAGFIADSLPACLATTTLVRIASLL